MLLNLVVALIWIAVIIHGVRIFKQVSQHNDFLYMQGELDSREMYATVNRNTVWFIFYLLYNTGLAVAVAYVFNYR